MQPIEFISKWKAIDLTESAASHSHFIDLCRLLGEETPTDADRDGSWYCFERGATKTTGGKGWADVWKRECFGWEYKGKHKDLTAAFVQLQRYAIALENPPLLVVCDLNRFRIQTNWTNSVSEVYEFDLDDLRDANIRQKLKWVWSEPDKLKPGKTRESAGLLPERMFRRMLEQAWRHPGEFPVHGSNLFRAMKEGGWIGYDQVDWFNGGLFDDDTIIPLDRDDITLVRRMSDRNWAEIDTSIFGTLFERGLDPDKESQIGAHYTDLNKIKLIVDPTISRPLLTEWESIKHTMLDFSSGRRGVGRRRSNAQHTLAEGIYRSFLERLRKFRVLDPACGSGNFLYVALFALKDIEHRVMIEAEELGFQLDGGPRIGPEAVLGIEKNLYAAELARVTVWIGEIQWMRRNGFDVVRNPILKPLDTIECRDAILNEDGSEAEWPPADVVIGNPPFLGDKSMRRRLGSDYTDALRSAFTGRVSGGSDLICYWFEKARTMLGQPRTLRVGLVATNAIRIGANRAVLDRIGQTAEIFDAWADEEWTLDGAAVRVSLICFGTERAAKYLSGEQVDNINSDLTSLPTDFTKAKVLRDNIGIALQGPTKGGAFDIPGELARKWLNEPLNPNGRPNSDVLKPWFNGDAVTERWRDKWIIDFAEMPEEEAAFYASPFKHVVDHVKPVRMQVERERRRRLWWQYNEPAPGMRAAIAPLKRFIVTPETPTHNVFVWLPRGVASDNNLVVIARDDDTSFGILHSRFHLHWIKKLGSPYGNHPTARRYNSSRVFRTYPFPDGLSPNRSAAFYASNPRAQAIAGAAAQLNELRNNWLNPSNLVRIVSEIVTGFPDRVRPVDASAASVLRTRTLTNLYNERPAWLAKAHNRLDMEVAAAYGWPADISDDDALARLLELNSARAAAERRPGRSRTREQLRREPEFPPVPIQGGLSPEQRPVPVDEAAPSSRPARRRQVN